MKVERRCNIDMDGIWLTLEDSLQWLLEEQQGFFFTLFFKPRGLFPWQKYSTDSWNLKKMDQLLEVVLEDSSSKTKCVIKSIQCVSTVLCYFLRATKTLPTQWRWLQSYSDRVKVNGCLKTFVTFPKQQMNSLSRCFIFFRWQDGIYTWKEEEIMTGFNLCVKALGRSGPKGTPKTLTHGLTYIFYDLQNIVNHWLILCK